MKTRFYLMAIIMIIVSLCFAKIRVRTDYRSPFEKASERIQELKDTAKDKLDDAIKKEDKFKTEIQNLDDRKKAQEKILNENMDILNTFPPLGEFEKQDDYDSRKRIIEKIVEKANNKIKQLDKQIQDKTSDLEAHTTKYKIEAESFKPDIIVMNELILPSDSLSISQVDRFNSEQESFVLHIDDDLYTIFIDIEEAQNFKKNYQNLKVLKQKFCYWVQFNSKWYKLVSENKLVYVEGGSFDMGKSLYENENNTHSVTVSSFFISKYEITGKEWNEIMEEESSSDDYDYEPITSMVNWYSAIKYCNKLSIKENLTPVYSVNNSTNPEEWGNKFSPTVDSLATGYRLPTEAEWEYAAKGGVNHLDNYLYSGTNNNLKDFAVSKSMEVVGSKLPNQLGIYDMTGNVRELCWDKYSVYRSEHVLRGGHYYSDSSVTDRDYPSSSKASLGFRVCRNK